MLATQTHFRKSKISMINVLKKISAITIFSLITNIFYFTQAKAAIDGYYSCSISGNFLVSSNAVVGNNYTCEGAAVIPDGVTDIGVSAFGRSNLTSVTIPDSVTLIEQSAFQETLLTSVTIPDSVLTIGIGAFSYNPVLSSVTIGNSVTTIGIDAFSYNPVLSSVTIGNSVTLIEQGAFRNTALISVIIPESVVTIGDVAFFRNTALTSVTIGNSVTTIGIYAFSEAGLTSVTIPSSIATIGQGAFSFNTDLTSVKFLGNAPLNIDTYNFGDAGASPGATAIVSSSALGFGLDVTDYNPGDNKWYGLIVSPVLAPAFTLSASSESRTVNTAATGFVVNSTGGAIESFAINQTPPGMTFNTSTGTLTGTPNTVAATTVYTITATNLSGSTTQTFALTVTAAQAIVDISAAEAQAAAEAAKKAREQKELTEILAIIPKIAELTLSLGEMTKAIIIKKSIVSGLAKKQPIKVTASELKQIQKLGKKLALEIAESNKGSVNEGAVASFAEGVRILYGK
jgi:hypothetical protein